VGHPLIDRARGGGVRQASSFHEAAAALAAELLRSDWDEEVSGAPSRRAAGKRYLAERRRPPARLGSGGRVQEPLALALWRHASDPSRALPLPGGGTLQLVGARVPLRSGAADATRADDPNRGVGEIDLLGVSDAGRLAVVSLAWVPSDAARAGTGDTPLRALLEALAACAIAWANRDALREEIADGFAVELSEQPPMLLLIGVPRYWELCRRRAAQRGAAWIQQMERLAGEVEAGLGVTVRYLAVEPVEWSLDTDGWPALAGPPVLAPAWEEGAGRVRPRPPRRPRPRTPAEEPAIEADPTRPVRLYAMTESYHPGDRIAHPLFGEGVVQGAAGPGKIEVRFPGEPRVLVHQRPIAGVESESQKLS
jgi:hypothetical protein